MAPSEIRLALEELTRSVDSLSRRMDRIEAEFRRVAERCDHLEIAPARAALERQKEAAAFFWRAVITSLVSAFIGGVVFVISKVLSQ